MPPTVTYWTAGAMTIRLDSTDTRPVWLVIAETYFPDWQATVDGTPAPLYPGNGAQLSLEVPPGARQVSLKFVGRGYGAGKLVTALSTLLALVLVVLPLLRQRRAAV